MECVRAVSADLPLRAVTEHLLELADLGTPGAALVDAAGGTVITWPRLARTIRAAARGLGHRGLAAGDTVGVLVTDAVSHAVAVHAVRAADGTALPIRAAADVADVAGRLRARRARLLITTAPLAGLAVEVAERSWVRQVFAFGEAAGTTPFRALTETADDDAVPGHDGAPKAVRDLAAALRDLAGLTAQDPGLIAGDVLVAAPPCGDPDVYASLLDLAVVGGATIVAAPVAQVTAAVQAYHGTAAIVPCGARVPLLPRARVFALG